MPDTKPRTRAERLAFWIPLVIVGAVALFAIRCWQWQQSREPQGPGIGGGGESYGALPSPHGVYVDLPPDSDWKVARWRVGFVRDDV